MNESWPIVVLINLFCSLRNSYFAGGLASALQVRLKFVFMTTVRLFRLDSRFVFLGR